MLEGFWLTQALFSMFKKEFRLVKYWADLVEKGFPNNSYELKSMFKLRWNLGDQGMVLPMLLKNLLKLVLQRRNDGEVCTYQFWSSLFCCLVFNIRDRPLLTLLLVSLSFVHLLFILPLWVGLVVCLVSLFLWVWSSLSLVIFSFLFLFNKFHVMALCLAWALIKKKLMV